MATSTITNTITGPTGTVQAGVRVVCRLMPTAGFRISDSTEVARVVETTTDGSGVWSLVLQENSDITPGNTWYEVTEYIPNVSGGTRVWRIEVGASDQTVLASLISPLPDSITSNYLTQAAGDARYQTLGGLSSSTPGTETPDHAGTAGVSTSASRQDHIHPIAAAAPTTVDLDGTGAASEGVSTSFARADHGHAAENDAWTAYTPALTASSSNPTLGTGSEATGTYIRNGRTIHGKAFIKFGTSGTAAGSGEYRVSLPVAARTGTEDIVILGACTIFDDPGSILVGTFHYTPSSGTYGRIYIEGGSVVTEASPFAWAASDFITVEFTYEAAS